MKIYQVGGAVRDKLLGIQATDIDHVVIGATPDEMIALGFKPVGKHFPVFLHPKTKAEYALARKEVKTGPKHTDFEFVFNKSVTLQEDVVRRDFTINALVYDEENNTLIDLVNGQDDLKNKLIRHIDSNHFVEDALRVLRMCRFAAQLNFDIHQETMALATQMVNDGMLQHLSKERVFQEFEKALATPHFDKFILCMRSCGALKELLPEIDCLFDVPEKEAFHPEKNSGAHTILALQAGKSFSKEVKFAILLHDVGKGTTPEHILPSHYEHDKRGEPLVQNICRRLKVPNKYKSIALLGSKMHMKLRDVPLMRLSKVYDFVSQISNAFKDKEKINQLFQICKADMLGRAAPLDQSQFDNFNQAQKCVITVFSLMQNIKITDMPNFASLPKDERIASHFKQYALKQLEQKIKELNL